MGRDEEFVVGSIDHDSTPSEFDYIVDRVNTAEFSYEPFPHIHISDFFSEDHFKQIVNSEEVNIPQVGSDVELFQALHRQHFEEIVFPGTTLDIKKYLDWRVRRFAPKNQRVEGFGVTLRLRKTRQNSILRAVDEFLKGPRFWHCLANKFGIDLRSVRAETGLQKYLDGYEISPHPDVRRKALTFMANVNPAPNSEDLDFHTRYLILKPERAYISKVWEAHPNSDRTWLKWEWCEVRKLQNTNNSFVVFAPANDTIHAVKASYDHLKTQRTQYYGNLWYGRRTLAGPKLSWQDLADEDRWVSQETLKSELISLGFSWRQMTALGITP